MTRAALGLLAVCGLLFAWPVDARQASSPQAPPAVTAESPVPPATGGPPVPVAPAVITRDAAGRATIRAVAVSVPLGIDGILDEAVYGSVRAISDFIQMEPDAGAPSSQKTEVWILFDDTHLYISGRCWEAHPERMVANEMRHDSNVLAQNEHLAVSLDTFHDRRNGVTFLATPLGGRAEGQVTNERTYNADFNPIWEVEVGHFDGGWTVEMAIPFKSLRYGAGRDQVWGLNVSRFNRWKNELSYITRLPNALGIQGLFQFSLAATLVGLEVPENSRNIEVKPFVLSNVTSDLTASPQVRNDPGLDAGVDVKYELTKNLTADLTYNTDFAQVEADEQQVNLTRFSLFFPEKREFFIENQGTFSFGGAGGFGSRDTPTLFYSRRIGLHQGRVVPIEGGGRLTGRIGRYSVGFLNIQSGGDEATGALSTNFVVARVKRDILRRSTIGALMTRRSVREQGVGSNEVYGADAALSFFDSLAINAYWARTVTDGLRDDDTSYRAQLGYRGDRYGVDLDHLYVGDNFNPEVGFVRRDDIRRTFGQFRFSPRPRQSRTVRRFFSQASLNIVDNGGGRRELRETEAELAIEFQNGDRVSATASQTYEFLPVPFTIARGVTLPVGGYDYWSVKGGYALGQQRRLAGTASVEYGRFYSGHRTVLGLSQGRLEVSTRFSLQPTVSINRIDLAEGAFTRTLAGARVTYTMTPLMFVSALLQYNTGNNSLAMNARLRWEYRPGSELFVVYNDQRDTESPGFPGLVNRAFIVKINRLLRF